MNRLKLLKIGALTICILVSPLAFAKPVGTVTFKTGNPTIIHADNTSSPAEKNSALNAGDTIDTADGRLQLSLMDGGKVSLQPNTIYKINKYAFSGKEDGSEFAFTELVKGGLRTVSGLIGHKNRDRYQLKTSVATIGIRGTEFTVNFNDNQLLMTTNHGSVDVCNQGGCLNAITGQTIAVAGLGAAPKPSNTPAKAAAAAPASSKSTFAANDSTSDSGLPTVIANAASANNISTGGGNSGSSGIKYDLLYISTLASDGSHENGVVSGKITKDSNGKITAFDEQTSQVTYSFDNALGDVYRDQYVTLGSTSGTKNRAGTIDNLIDFQGIVGTLTGSSNLLNLASITTPLTYNVLGSTGATAIFNNNSVISATTGSSNSVTGNFTVNFGTLVYGYNLNNIAVNSYTFSIAGSNLSLVAGSNQFSNAGVVTETSGNTSNINACLPSCAGHLANGDTVQGAFFGANAERIGLQYSFSSNMGEVFGGVVLGR